MTLGGGIGFAENVRRTERRAGREERQLQEMETRGQFQRSGFENRLDFEEALMGLEEQQAEKKMGRSMLARRLELDYQNALAQGNADEAQQKALELIRERGRVAGLKSLQDATFDLITRGQGGAGGTTRGLGLGDRMTDTQRKQFELLMNNLRTAQSLANKGWGLLPDANAKVDQARQEVETFLRGLQGGAPVQPQGAPQTGLGAGTTPAPTPTVPTQPSPTTPTGATNPASLAATVIAMSQGDAGETLAMLRKQGLGALSKQFAGFSPEVAQAALGQLRGTIGQAGGATAGELEQLMQLADTPRVVMQEGIQKGGYAQDPTAYGDAAFDAAAARDTRVGPVLPGGVFAANTLFKNRAESGKLTGMGMAGPELLPEMSQDGSPQNGMAMFNFVIGLNEIFAGSAAGPLPPLQAPGRPAAAQFEQRFGAGAIAAGGGGAMTEESPFSGFLPPGGGGLDAFAGQGGVGNQAFVAGPQPAGILPSEELYNRIVNAAIDNRPEWQQVLSLAQQTGVGSALMNQEQLLAKHKLGRPTPTPGSPTPLTANEDLGMRLHQQGIQAKLGLMKNIFADFERQLAGAGR